MLISVNYEPLHYCLYCRKSVAFDAGACLSAVCLCVRRPIYRRGNRNLPPRPQLPTGAAIETYHRDLPARQFTGTGAAIQRCGRGNSQVPALQFRGTGAAIQSRARQFRGTGAAIQSRARQFRGTGAAIQRFGRGNSHVPALQFRGTGAAIQRCGRSHFKTHIHRKKKIAMSDIYM